MKIRDPSIRSCYSHHLLSKIEEDIDDYRDKHGDDITDKTFKQLISKYQRQVPEEATLLYDLAYESFIQDDHRAIPFIESNNFEGCGYHAFPEYSNILSSIGKHSDEMWEAYDKKVHSFCKELCKNVSDKNKVLQTGTKITKYQLSFDEESCVIMHTIFFVLKTLVPNRTDSKYQNSIKRAEIWLQEALLM